MAHVMQFQILQACAFYCLPPPITRRILMWRQPCVSHKEPLLLTVHTDVLDMGRKQLHQAVGDVHQTLRSVLRERNGYLALSCPLDLPLYL
jgi:hypothetical protein